MPAMAPEDRRAALVEATLPLLREHGTAVSTRQIAEAAGVAEGTIFGVFPDKASLVRATLVRAFDPRPAVEEIEAVGTELELRARLVRVVGKVRQGMAINERLHIAARDLAMEDEEFGRHLVDSRNRIIDALAALMEPDRDRLHRSPRTAAHLLLMLIAVAAQAKSSYGADEIDDMDDAQIVSLLLDGLLVRPSQERHDDDLVLLGRLLDQPETPTPDTESSS
ncbi:hypothetical protein GCM10027203_37280 [Nonomuraea fastidiosa]